MSSSDVSSEDAVNIVDEDEQHSHHSDDDPHLPLPGPSSRSSSRTRSRATSTTATDVFARVGVLPEDIELSQRFRRKRIVDNILYALVIVATALFVLALVETPASVLLENCRNMTTAYHHSPPSPLVCEALMTIEHTYYILVVLSMLVLMYLMIRKWEESLKQWNRVEEQSVRRLNRHRERRDREETWEKTDHYPFAFGCPWREECGTPHPYDIWHTIWSFLVLGCFVVALVVELVCAVNMLIRDRRMAPFAPLDYIDNCVLFSVPFLCILILPPKWKYSFRYCYTRIMYCLFEFSLAGYGLMFHFLVGPNLYFPIFAGVLLLVRLLMALFLAVVSCRVNRCFCTDQGEVSVRGKRAAQILVFGVFTIYALLSVGLDIGGVSLAFWSLKKDSRLYSVISLSLFNILLTGGYMVVQEIWLLSSMFCPGEDHCCSVFDLKESGTPLLPAELDHRQ